MTRYAPFIDDLLHDLAHEAFPHDDVFNQYSIGDSNNDIRRANLRRYLNIMRERQPTYLLVMEAPGYRGCRLTGLPVTSRKVMLEGVPELDIFGEAQGFQNVSDTGFENVHGEQSATIVWQTLADLKVLPLIWNTFPFHPCKASKPRSNRRPRKPETTLGSRYLHDVVDYFKPEVIVAVGNVAEETMMSVGINCLKVRHPAQGGKQDFVAGVSKIFTTTGASEDET
ncbi:MAG: uracil-DNA glycosylase [Chloroflexota bacterium]